jgi:L-iditol 2-dehydrogenase
MAAETMKAVVYAGPGDIRLEERPLPGEPGPGEILVRVHVCGICGSDVTDWYMNPRAPVVLGHEPAGDVVAVGAGVTAFTAGDRVALHHHVPCMVCDLCQHGKYTSCPTFKRTRLYPAGMAEYVRVPAEIVERDILKIPDNLPYEVGALVEPIACCVRSLDHCDIQRGDTVVILGAGFNGVTMALIAPRWGADQVAVLDRLPMRLERARGLGLQTFNVDDADIREQVRAWARKGPHAVIVTASNHAALNLGFDLCAPGATFMMYAPSAPGQTWPLDANRVLFQEITVRGTYSSSPFDTRRALELMSNGFLDPNVLVTHRLPLTEAATAWQITKMAGDSLKVMVEL